MARLRNVRDGREVTVGARLRVGRAPDAGLRLTHACVSQEHALVRWGGDGWEVRDLGSRNGTFVDGRMLTAGETRRVDLGSRLAFGDVDDVWDVVEADPPTLFAICEDGEAVGAGQDGLLVLPSPEAPEVAVYASSTGAWVLEGADGDRTEIDDDTYPVEAGGQQWQVHLPAVLEGTPAVQTAPTLDAISMRFAVSQDEERVQVDVVHRGRVTALEPAWHGYVLLTLARLRAEAEGQPEPERGWVDRDALLRMLRMDTNGLNVAIHKARSQLLAAGVLGGAGIVEVRRGARRFGIDRFEIHRMP